MIALQILGAVALIVAVAWLSDNLYGGTDDGVPENDEDVRARMTLESQRENDSTAA